MTLIFRTFVISEVTFAAWTAGIPVLRSAKGMPAYVNRKRRQRYCLVGERSRVLSLLKAAQVNRTSHEETSLSLFIVRYCRDILF